MEKGRISIFLIDDHEIFRQGLVLLISGQPDIEVVGQAGSGVEALTGIREVHPDVVLLDLSLPDMNGLELLAQVKKTAPESKILVLTMHDNQKYVSYALSHGVSGYLLKDLQPEELFLAIRSVMQGDIYLCRRVNKLVIREFASMTRDHKYLTSLETLTAREREVFRLMADGYCGKDIAARLNISPKTVEHHRGRIMDKLDCENIAQVIRLALKEGVINP